MNDWEKEFWAVMDAVTATVEDWVEEIEQTITEVSTALEEEVSAEWEGFWQDWSTFWEEVTEGFTDLEPDAGDLEEIRYAARQAESPTRSSPSSPYSAAPWLSREWDMGLNPHRPATAEHQPACQGCRHYHGYIYGGKLLVCGMHPYGNETGNCPDWEASSPNAN
ncbi:MAG: hypothetical protein ACO36E_04380 [Synechocystis sp.]